MSGPDGPVSRVPRLASLPSWWPWAAAGVGAVVVVTLGWLVLLSPFFSVRAVEVVGERQVTERQVLDAAAVRLGTPLARVDVDGVVDRVRDLEAVAGVTVTRGWPDTVRIEVTERRALAVVRTDDGFGVLGSDGVVYRTVTGPQPGLPFLDQQDGAAATDPRAAACLSVALGLPPRVSARVATIRAAEPDAVVLTLRNGARVDWGSAAATGRKAEVLLLLLPRRADRYDVSAPESPVTVG